MVGEVTIKKLSNEVKSYLRSGIAISSITQCVEELVLNAIDGGATCIAVRVDLNIFRIQVVDNGHGISEEDLKFIGNRYATSKCHSLEDLNKNLSYYGFRGEALASIIQLGGVIEISSKHKNSKLTYSKLFTYGQQKGIIICDTNRPSVGTTVTVQDFMHNMPVRRKIIKESIDLEKIRMQIECIALINPNISITIRNDTNNKTILQTKKSKTSLDTFSQIFGNNHLTSMTEAFHSVNKFAISGYISTQPYHSRALQFIYVNKRYTLQTKIHSFINELFNRTSIIRGKMQCVVPHVHTDKITHSPTKGIRYFGVFFLNIECPLSEYDICFDPRKTLVEFKDWHNLIVCIEEMMLKFVKEEGLSISLDDRFRKSEKETFDSYSESPMPHSSSSLLQAFSNSKINNTIDSKISICKDDISIKNIRTAVHSFPANREKVIPVMSNVTNEQNICYINQSKFLEKKMSETLTTIPNTSEISKLDGSNLLMNGTKMSNESLPNTLISDKKMETKGSALQTTNWPNPVSKCQKNSSISALKKLSKVLLNSGDQFATTNSKLTKDGSEHLSSIQELKCIYNKKISKNTLTPAIISQPIIYSPEPSKIALSKYDNTEESIDLYYSKHVNLSKPKVQRNGLSGSLSLKLKQKKKETLIKNTLNSFKFKKRYQKTEIFSKSKNKRGQVSVLDDFPSPIVETNCDSSFYFDPVTSHDKKNNLICVPMIREVNDVSDINSPHCYVSNVLNETSQKETEHFKFGKTVNKSCVVSQFSLENSYRPIDTLNTAAFENKSQEINVTDEKISNPSHILNGPDKINILRNNNTLFFSPSLATNAKDNVNQGIYDHNNYSKKIEDVAFNIEMVGILPGNENYESTDMANNKSTTDSTVVAPFETCSIINSFNHIYQHSTPVGSVETSDILNSQTNAKYANYGCVSNGECSSNNFESKQHSSDHYIGSSFEAITTDRIYIPVSNSLNEGTPLNNNPQHDLVYNNDFKEMEADFNKNCSFSMSTLPFNTAVKPLLQPPSLGNNFGSEHVTIETSKNISNLDNSICSMVERPYFSEPISSSNNINNQLPGQKYSESNGSNISNVAIGEKKIFDELPYNDCGNLERDTSSSIKIVKDLVINNEDNFLPIKRKMEGSKEGCLKIQKLNTVTQCMPVFATTTNILQNIDIITPDSSMSDLVITKTLDLGIKLSKQVEAFSKRPDCNTSNKIDISNEIAQKSSLNSTLFIDSNEVGKLCNASHDCNSTENCAKCNLEICNKDLLDKVKENLLSPQHSSIEAISKDCNGLNPCVTESSVNDGPNSQIISPISVSAQSVFKQLNDVEDFQSICMEQALDSFLNEHTDLHCIYNSDNKDSSHFNIGKLWDDWAVPKIAMNTQVLSSLCEEHERFSSIKSYNLVHPYKFQGEMLQNCKVLGQVDIKFIAIILACNSMQVKNSVLSEHFNLIALVDQHAADERVQLEKVLALSYDKNTLQLKRKQLLNPFEIHFRPEEVRIMKAYRGAFEDLGLEFTMVNCEVVLFHSLPCSLVAQDQSEKYTRRCQTASKVIEATVREMCENIRIMGGTSENLGSRPLPKPLQHIYNTIACKSAIKFGDELSMERCIKLIKMLSKCKLPFQCAHGRPSIIPVVDLNYLQVKSKNFESKPRINFHKLVASKFR